MNLRSTPIEPAPLFPPGADTLRAFSGADFEPLVTAGALERLSRVAEAFPLEAHTVCFETRLAADDSRVDLAFAVLRDRSVPRSMSRLDTRESAGSWARFAAFLHSWVEPESKLGWQIPFLCVAFDLEASFEPERVALPAPCVSLCVDPGFFLKRMGDPAPSATADEVVGLAADCQLLLTGQDLRPADRARLRRLLAPTGVEAKHVSLMLSRPGAPLKVDLRLPLDALPSYLQAVGWPADADAIARRLRQLVPWGGHVQLNLWADPAAAPTLDVEIFAGNPEATPEDRARFLEALVGAGLAAAPKARVLSGISGRSLHEGGGLTVAKNWYVKLRFLGEEVSDAKAYLALMPRPFLRREGAPQSNGIGQA